MTGALASHYSHALAEAVFRPGSELDPKEAAAQLREIDSLLSGSKDLELALLSPAVHKTQKQAVVSKLADELGLHRLIRNFLLVVVSHRRTKEFSAIRQDFERIVDERLGWVPAEIFSARELSAQQRKLIERTLGTHLGKFIRANYTVDPSLLGGVRARVASREYDASIRGKLDAMRQRLLANL